LTTLYTLSFDQVRIESFA